MASNTPLSGQPEAIRPTQPQASTPHLLEESAHAPPMLAPIPSSNSTNSLSQEIAELKLLIKQLTSRVTRLEMSSRQAEKSKATTTTIANAPTTTPPVSTSIPQRSYATTAAAAASQPETPWTTIHKKSRTPAAAPPSDTTPLPTKAQRRIVITRSSKVPPKVDNLIMRNTINNALTKVNTSKHILILSITYNRSTQKQSVFS